MNFQLHHWPALVVGWLLMTFIVSYIVAVLEGNIAPLFPYISEMGAWQPSSTVFGQLMNIAAILTAITLYIRYRQVDSAIETQTCSLNKKWNKIELWLGFVVALGISIVANFQGDIKGNRGIIIMHFIGAVMAFGIGGIYLAIQVIITFGLRPYYEKYTEFGVCKFIQYFRLISIIIYFINTVTLVVFALATPRESNGYRLQGLLPKEDGYTFRAISVFSEWLLATIFGLNILTVTNELKAISFQDICLKRADMLTPLIQDEPRLNITSVP